ncbi:LacI family DNA-binding transcriptional regulator [Rubellicoccus peritrichatus]|uniref:LacI family DNA-binding transcriptional regulator n=1 Tax=Rubellicoccus peritrichatus TaxID=3080537 RepID=A0AAQ3QRM8_9BACT|nr:LacI family DNA-binding transcriptional regulator [Puniceicoccus sp. CR14]WOO41468.1 LacI family DNA-binding transcriptional regulator [Puniceicoccus sp. CR14]
MDKLKGKRPTVGDLVKLTGFSQGAISRAFNGRGGISEATREKILKAAGEIGYHPNPSARNFKRGYTGRIGIILPNLRNTNYSELYEQLDLVMADSGVASSLALTHASVEREANTILHWSAGETDALIVNPVPDKKNIDLYRKLKSWRYPLLFIYDNYANEFDSLGVDYRLSLRQAMMYLRDVGHKKVAYVGTAATAPKSVGKLAMLYKVLEELGIEFDEELSVLHVPGKEAGPRAFSKWRVMGRRPSAVVAFNDQTAASIYSEATSLGLKVPEDLSLLGSDDVDQAEAIGLSTIRIDRTEMAKTIYDMLQNRMKDFDSPIRIQQMRSELILRRSMGPVSGKS